MRTIAVGQLLAPGVRHYDEIPEYNYRGAEPGGYHRLILPLRHPRSIEIRAFKTGTAEFAFGLIGPALVFLYRFGPAIGWGDAFYTYHKLPAAEQTLPPVLTGQQRALVECILVEANTGIVKALRVVSFSPDFSRLLHEAIRKQAAAPYPADYDRQVRALMDKYDTQQLLAQAQARCFGGS